MGGNQSTSTSVVQETTSNIMMNTIVNRSQNCTSTSTIVQSINLSAGDSSNIVIANTTMDATIQSKLTCLMSAKFTQSDVSELQSQLQNSLSKSNISWPNINNTATNQNLTQKFASYVSTNANINSVLSTAQTTCLQQEIVAKVGNSSNIIIDHSSMTAGLQVFQDACLQESTNLIRNFANTSLSSGTLSSEEKNALQPFADTATSVSKDVAGVANNVVDKAGSIANTALMTSAIIFICIIIGLIVALKFGLLDLIISLSPFGMLSGGHKKKK